MALGSVGPTQEAETRDEASNGGYQWKKVQALLKANRAATLKKIRGAEDTKLIILARQII